MELASTSVHTVEWAPKNACCQCLCPQGELQLPPASLGDSPTSSGGSEPGSFQMTASALGPGACEILCEPFKNGVSISHSSLGLPKVSPIGLQSQTFWGLDFLMQDPRAEVPHVGLRPSLFGENLCNCNYSFLWGGSPTWGYGSWLYCASAPPTHLIVVPSLYLFW